MIGHPFWAIMGTLLILFVAYDCTRTTLSASSSGPLTNRLSKGTWSVLMAYHRRRPHHSLLGAAGTWVTLTLIFCWLSLTWLGWWLVFCGDPQAVVNSTSMATASLIERAYFVGYTITTLGYGDLVPNTSLYQILCFLAAGNGFLLFTLSITYAIPIVSAATQKRQLALSINALGHDPLEIIRQGADDGSFQSLCNQLQQVQSSIVGSSQQHLAYPILHYFHSEETNSALPLALARLDEALSMILFSCTSLPSTSRSQMAITQRSIDEFLHTLESAFVHPTREAPDIPELEGLSMLSINDTPPSAIRDHLQALDRQKLLLAFVENDGWEWQDVWQATRDQGRNSPAAAT
ncbi:ion channel [Halomonas shantousis]